MGDQREDIEPIRVYPGFSTPQFGGVPGIEEPLFCCSTERALTR